MAAWLRRLAVFLIFGEGGCRACGRRPYWPGALWCPGHRDRIMAGERAADF